MTRVISGVVLAVIALGAIVWLPTIALRVLACIVAALALIVTGVRRQRVRTGSGR